MGYKKQAILGVSWTVALQGSTKFFGLIKIFVLARILSPQQFGIFGIATLMLTLLETLTETGVNVFLIQEKEKINEYLDSAWIVSIGRGVLISLILFLTAPLVASFFHTPGVLSVLYFISLVPLVRGFINPAEVVFQKDLFFDKEFYFRFVLLVVDAIVSISLALLTHSVSSIVAGQFASATVEVFISFIIFQSRPWFRFHREYINKVFHRGKWITLAGTFNYFFMNFDDFIVGRLLNAVQLGFYQMAYKFSIYLATQISDIVGKVTFPVYTKIAEDMPRLKSAFFKTIIFTVGSTIVYAVAIWFLIPIIVPLLLGTKWLTVVPLVQLLAFAAPFRAFTGIIITLFFALKKQQYLTVTTFINFLGIALPVIPLVMRYGTTGAIFAVYIGCIAGFMAELFYLFKIFRLNITYDEKG